MPKLKTELEPEKSMTKAEALALSRGIASQLEDLRGDALAGFILLLRWLAYKADATDREETYILTEDAYAMSFDGVDEAVRQGLQQALNTLRKYQARKGEGR